MAHTSPLEVRVTQRYAAPAERVFAAWVDPAQIRVWMKTSGAMKNLSIVETDPRLGGKFSFVDMREGLPFNHHGTYLVFDRPRLLVFTWAVEKYSDAPVTVTIEFTPLPDGGSEATLSHAVPPEWAEYIEHTRAAWAGMMGGVATLIDG